MYNYWVFRDDSLFYYSTLNRFRGYKYYVSFLIEDQRLFLFLKFLHKLFKTTCQLWNIQIQQWRIVEIYKYSLGNIRKLFFIRPNQTGWCLFQLNYMPPYRAACTSPLINNLLSLKLPQGRAYIYNISRPDFKG